MSTASRPVAIAAGGTGGHVFPALAVADVLRKQGVPVVWFGTRRGIEAKIIPPTGIPLVWLSVSGLRGKGFAGRLTGPLRLCAAVVQSIRAFIRLRPLAVLGMGGYVTGPVGLAAKLTGTPLVLHEQNSVAGFTNKKLARFASTVFSAMPGAFAEGVNAVTVGNPLRDDIEQCAEQHAKQHADEKARLTSHEMVAENAAKKTQRYAARNITDDIASNVTSNVTNNEANKVTKHVTNNNGNSITEYVTSVTRKKRVLSVLVVGGSQGAQVLNNVVPEVVKQANFPMKIVHQTGLRMYESVQDRYALRSRSKHEISVNKFIENMMDAYLEADLVVCRSGAMTVSEIAAMSLPSVLVPFPHAVDDHQTGNARHLESACAAVVIPQSEFTVQKLGEVLEDFYENRDRLTQMGIAARQCHLPGAAHKVANALLDFKLKVNSKNHEVNT